MRFILTLLFLLMTTGCSSVTSYVPKEAFESGPTLAAHTSIQDKLMSLPAAQQKIVVSVYEFNDQTGQNKPSEFAQYSRAVTQGGLSIVKKALLDASNHQWFRVLERGGLQNLLQERKIIRATRAEHKSPNGSSLPQLEPLLYSGVLLEGGIVAYESNVTSGGVGAAYLGIGASSKYSRDMVTVYLRLVSVKSGEVLLSVNSSKTIYSYGMQGGVFKFVSFDELAEGEAGYTLNEPPQLAVRQAIEMSVYAMVMEGYHSGLWSFRNENAGRAAWNEYYNNYVALNRSGYANKNEGGKTSSKNATAQQTKPERKVEMAKQRAPMQKQPARMANKTVSSTTVARKQVAKKSIQKKDREWVELAHNQTPKAAAAKKQQMAQRKAPEPTIQMVEESWSQPKNPTSDIMIFSREEMKHGWYIRVMAVRDLGAQEQGIIRELERAGLRPVVENIGNYYRILLGAYSSALQVKKAQLRIIQISGSIGIPEDAGIYSITRI